MSDPADAMGDESIPLLTEIVQVPRYPPVDLPVSLSEVDWSPLANRVRENVIERLMRRSELLLETRLRDRLQAVVDRHIDSLKAELRGTLDAAIRDIVSQAVDEELTRLQAEISRRGT